MEERRRGSRGYRPARRRAERMDAGWESSVSSPRAWVSPPRQPPHVACARELSPRGDGFSSLGGWVVGQSDPPGRACVVWACCQPDRARGPALGRAKRTRPYPYDGEGLFFFYGTECKTSPRADSTETQKSPSVWRVYLKKIIKNQTSDWFDTKILQQFKKLYTISKLVHTKILTCTTKKNSVKIWRRNIAS